MSGGILFKLKKFQKVIIWTLAGLLSTNFYFFPKKVWAYTYNPPYLEASHSFYDVNRPKTVLYWGKPLNINDYNAKNGRTDTSKLIWVVNIYEQGTREKWDSHNNKYEDTQMAVIDFMKWQQSYDVIVDLRDTFGGGEKTIGQIKRSFIVPIAPSQGASSSSGDCPVQYVEAYVENFDNAPNKQKVHFTWKWKPGCAQIVNIYRPATTGTNLGEPLVTNYQLNHRYDDNPREGIYMFISRTDTDIDGRDNGMVGKYVSLATLGSEQPGESKDPDAPGNKGKGGSTDTDGEASYCDQFTASWGRGLIKTILNPLGATVCALIRAFEEMAHWILEQATDVINA